MRRKSKKTKEEPKESSSERRSKRSSTRRKRAYEDDEGGSGVEEERTTEEEMTPTKAKDRGSKRYATRGRRQKAEESEDEEVSQAEEEQVDCEEESSKNLPIVTEPVNRENEIPEDFKGLKSGGAISEKSIVSEGNDGAGARKSDKQMWEMKSKKDSQEDTGGIAEETPAQGEGDDGEEEGSRSHSRKRKLKLSRECLQENREAIPKIRLRLSRNRSGGYETEKLEAERIETKRIEEETLVKVIKVKPIIEEKESISSEQVICKGQTEEIVPKEKLEEVCKELPEEVCKEQPEEICKEQPEEVCKEQPEEVCKEQLEEVCKEQPEEVCKEQPEEVCKEQPEEVCKEQPEEVCKEQPEEVCKEQPEEVCIEQSEEVQQKVDSPESEEKEPEEVLCKEETEEVEQKVESPEVGNEEAEEAITEVGGEEDQEEEGHQESSKEETPVPEIAEEEEKLDRVLPMEEKEQRTEPEETNIVEKEESMVVEEAKTSSASPVEKEKEDEMEEKSEEQEVEPEKQVEAPNEAEESEEERDEEVQEKQVSEAGEVSDQVTVEEDKEARESRDSDSEKARSDEREASDAEEVKGEPEETVEERKDVEVKEIVKEEIEAVNKSKDSSKGDMSADCDEARQTNEETSAVMKELREEEQEPKSGSSERVGRISRSKLRHDEDAGEEVQTQKRRRRRRSRSRGSSGSEHRRQSTTSPTSEAQPKRVTLKRPRLIRSVSSVSAKSTTIEEETVQKESEPKVEEDKEEKNQVEPTTEEITQQEESKTEHNIDAEEATKKKKRKWGQQKSQVGPSHTKRAFFSISTHSLKGLIPEVKPLPIHELRLSVEKDEAKDICMEEEESCEASMDETIVRMIDTNGQNERTVWAQVVDDGMRASIHPEAPRIPVLSGAEGSASAGPVRRISIVSDDATRLQRSPSPPRHPPSSVLFLSNLVRPFTVQQLKELLARTGTVVEDGFWIDRIKSMCLVQYETEEQARETRHALHGVRWPISNPKRLWVDFATKERLEEAKREGNVPPPPPAATGPSLTPPHPAPRDDFPRKTEPLRVDGSGMVPIHHPVHRGTPSSPGRPGHAIIRQQGPIMAGGPVAEAAAADSVAWQQRGRPRSDAPPIRPGANARDFKLSAPVREWDLDKVVQQSPPRAGIHGPNRGPVDERRRAEATGQPSGRRDRMLPSPPPSMQEIQARKAKRKEAEAAAAAAAEAPANLLDSLFRKTKATPSIYWLPLTAEQIKVKEEMRRQHLAEHERRMAEMKRAAEKERGGRRRRRSSSPRRRSRRRSGEGSSAVHKKPSESMKGHKTTSASPKK